MSTIKCPECNKEIPDSTNECPYCGYYISLIERKYMTNIPTYTLNTQKNNYENVIASLIQKTGLATILLGAIGTVVLFILSIQNISNKNEGINLLTIFLPLVASFVPGILLIGFGELLQMIERIQDNIATMSKILENASKRQKHK